MKVLSRTSIASKMLVFFIVLFQLGWDNTFGQESSLYQYSTFSALSGGLYDSPKSIANVIANGDFGIGTFNALDGELVMLNGKVYKAKADSLNGFQTEQVSANEYSPFFEAVYFKADTVLMLKNALNLSTLDSIISAIVPSANIMYAIKVTANFDLLKCRSVRKQSKPYKKLIAAVKEQKIWNFKNTSATLVGFYMPEYMKDINVPGYHWHALSSDYTKGGHLLDFQCQSTSIEICFIRNFKLQLPSDSGFDKSTLKSSKQETDFIEKNK